MRTGPTSNEPSQGWSVASTKNYDRGWLPFPLLDYATARRMQSLTKGFVP